MQFARSHRVRPLSSDASQLLAREWQSRLQSAALKGCNSNAAVIVMAAPAGYRKALLHDTSHLQFHCPDNDCCPVCRSF